MGRTVISFSEWLETRDVDLSQAIQNEVDWGQILRHPIKSLGRGLKSLKTPALNTAMALPLAIGGVRSAIPEMPEMEPASPMSRQADLGGMARGLGGHMGVNTPSENEPEQPEKEGGIPGIDELAHYVAEKLTKKLYELDAKMTAFLKRSSNSLREWFNLVVHKLIGAFRSHTPQSLNPKALAQDAERVFGQSGHVITTVIAATWGVIKEVWHKFFNEPPPAEFDASVADVAALHGKKSQHFTPPELGGFSQTPPSRRIRRADQAGYVPPGSRDLVRMNTGQRRQQMISRGH